MTTGKTETTGIWLRCKAEPGMLPAEFAVEVNTVESGFISFFAPTDKVSPDMKAVHVELLDASNKAGILVRLPAQPFEISSRNVRVFADALLAFEAKQKNGPQD